MKGIKKINMQQVNCVCMCIYGMLKVGRKEVIVMQIVEILLEK